MARRIGTEPTYGFNLNPWHLLLLVGVAIGSYYLANSHWGTGERRTLPKYYPAGLGAHERDTIYQRIPPFELTNQRGETLSIARHDTLPALIVARAIPADAPLADSCRAFLQGLSNALDEAEDVWWLTFVLPPNPEGVPAGTAELASLAQSVENGHARFHWLSGSWDELYLIVNNGLHIDVEQEDADVRVENKWVLLDPLGIMRGRYRGCSDEELARLLDDLHRLREEVNSKNL